ncbi:hypothetical protein CC85DRAFT_286564 [Cutaneotrichosporon oleaginosum]|uniref:Helicase C-terminal domain-containing protein n=1 Tax=Cutaneotrichosporon oleaginosum TaxID=879819 RepID=A0A0J0XJX4_9TREE|nr:uncharacterized protein CC85DRAFT_286564 [Cutaneotrichosporon oleaginosum]KLT41386.1 hypothetical protein CC85DRAFT_286564 [Cutaneotrichosporon oleaginosum]TXT06328.1 hypothetical protein COLE_05659 [Cutaneotrichosporon oleaginosum]
MQALYALIENPPEPSFGPPQFICDEEVFEGLRTYSNPPGVITALHAYQIRSVARMLQMETEPGTMPDPSYSRCTSATGEPYFVNLSSMEITRSPAQFALSRGGILCEQMGVGKTLICLALVLVSLNQHTSLPEGMDVTQVLSDDELRTYSTATMATMRTAIGLGEDAALAGPPWTDAQLTGTPRLQTLCADIVAKMYPRASRVDGLSANCRRLLDRPLFYYRFPDPVRRPRSAKLVRHVPPQRMFVATSTLVVVPPILVKQWLGEVEKHLVPGALRVLVVEDNKEDLPPIHTLMAYDIILMSLDRFRREGQREDGEPPRTPLLSARWKRIILDEGNNAANVKSDAVLLATQLSIERRWIVSGTPTLYLKQGTESVAETLLQSEGMQRVDSAAESRASTPLEPTHITTKKGRSRPKLHSPVPGQWSKADESDLERLGHMLSGFLASEIFNIADFRKWVKKPLRAKDGPGYGAIERVRQLMSAVMVKHRPGVIDSEVPLPKSTMAVEPLHLSHWQRLTYNALMGLVAANVYTSEGQDPDYLLHSKNLDSLHQVIINFHLAMTWFTSTDMDLEGAMRRTSEHLAKKRHKMAPERIAAIETAIAHIREAAETPGWREWMDNGAASLPFRVLALPLPVAESWSEAPDHEPFLVDAHSLIQLRKLNTRGAEANALSQSGWDERAKKPRAQAFLASMAKAEKQWRVGDPEPASRPRKHGAADKPNAPRVARNRAFRDTVDVNLDLAARNATAAAADAADRPRPLPATISTLSVSNKINWVVRAVLSAPRDQFLIFATWEESAHLSEAFALARVRSVYAGVKVDRGARVRALAEFQAGAHVCILDLKLGSRGLDLTVANRMVFLGPVWNPDVQAQAVKRIHRIGQTRPTRIDILVTQGTFEEDIVRREAARRSTEDEQRYSRMLVEQPRFVHAESTDEYDFPVSFVPPGTASVAEEAAYAALLADFARRHADADAPSPTEPSAVSTAIVTPVAAEIEPPGTGTKRPSTANDKPRKRARFADI